MTWVCRTQFSYTTPVPDIPVTDPSYTDVLFLAHFNGTNGSSTIVDDKNSLTITNGGAVTLSTAQFKFGVSSLLCSGGATSYATKTGGLSTMTGDFTVECWAYPTALSGNQVLLDLRAADVATPLNIGVTAAGLLRYYDGTTIRTGGSVPANTWTHVAWCRSGTTNYLFTGGTLVLSFTNGFAIGPGQCVIGSNANPAASEHFVGYIDDVRITKSARYTATFTPPTAQFPDS